MVSFDTVSNVCFVQIFDSSILSHSLICIFRMFVLLILSFLILQSLIPLLPCLSFIVPLYASLSMCSSSHVAARVSVREKNICVCFFILIVLSRVCAFPYSSLCPFASARFYLIVPALSIVPPCELAEKSPVRGETTETVEKRLSFNRFRRLT